MTYNVLTIKTGFMTTLGVIGSAIAGFFGGWSEGMTTLLIFMGIDYLTGIIVAAVFHNSPKTESGSLKSVAGLKGLCKKCGMLLCVLIAVRLDMLLGIEYIRDCVVIAFIVNEATSILENLGLMGIKFPKIITSALDVLNRKAEQGNEDINRNIEDVKNEDVKEGE